MAKGKRRREEPSRKIRAARVDPATRMARILLPIEQARPGAFEEIDVANRSDGDQRHSIRSGETKTIRRTPKLQSLVKARVITQAEAATCQWYIDQHCAGFDTVGVTANYGGSVGAATTGFTHLSKHVEQARARHLFSEARTAIDPMLVHLFERVVLDGRPMGRLVRSFRLAIAQLRRHLDQVGEVA
ncbi:hypothetical protein GGQ97_002323 [Sphingomonas kaistensis]|uniref:Uncharacterized protein n=1 Tax=Sphingomonas kaistensis TaxID=298708 RepID=A0A7X6BHH1_9SPHN|nr:hypothetical protein [Sphingomonas kaistensis]NJC06530.1 hypothetical protein [Sphingomonas kaistensis]